MSNQLLSSSMDMPRRATTPP